MKSKLSTNIDSNNGCYLDLILPSSPKPNRLSRDLPHAVQSYDMTPIDFLHHENPPTWTGVEPGTLSAEGQRQTNHAIQLAKIEISEYI
ncbi:hypothetical protein TNCV_670401 [Trichonephila clavipes]|nr:hypothetical protein TNCV_670401 [Trichonephila clavipes]